MENRETRRGIFSSQRQEFSTNEMASKRAKSPRNRRRKTPTFSKQWVQRIKISVAIALVLACLATVGNILYHHFRYASYQPAQCVIQYEQVQYIQPSGSDDSSPYYEPEVTYQIISPSNANPNTNTGYAGPGSFQEETETADKAQSLLNPYQVGQTYPCWYSSFGIQPEAVLILQPFAWWEIALASFGTLTIGFLLFLIILLLIFLAAQIRHLRKKGVFTTGIVQKKKVEFALSSEPIKKIRVPYITNGKKREEGTEVTVLYDPRDPRHTFRIANSLAITKSLKREEFTLWCFIVLFWLPIIILALALFLVA